MQAELSQLNDHDAAVRQGAFDRVLTEGVPATPETQWVNMHLHTFFSFNGEGYSPARIAWEAKRRGLHAIAICDFDVLAGMGELFGACDQLGMRCAAGFESRTFFAEYADQEINSPGEPGVFYFMGMGFVEEPRAGSLGATVLADMLDRSHTRNRALISRINAHLDDLRLDYDTDVLPLTPLDNATERHIVRAFHERALALHSGSVSETAAFWAAKLGKTAAELEPIVADTNAATDMLRSKLMKRGGVGYAQPDETTFPRLDDVIPMILDCRAIPMSTWLDGTSEGESDPESQLECLTAKGVAAVNIIPDRNWNFSDPDVKARKVAELNRYIEAALALDLPINVGTELNKPGQKFVDDFDAAPLKPWLPTFVEGAQVMVGHTRLLRYADLSYVDEQAAAEFTTRSARNTFFAAVGALPCPAPDVHQKLLDMPPYSACNCIHDSVKAGAWKV